MLPVVADSTWVLPNRAKDASLGGLSWFDAHLWAYAEYFGLDALLSEDFQAGRIYGSVRIIDPFIAER